MSLPFSLTYYDPPQKLARHVVVLFHFSTDAEITEDAVSGALPQFNVFPRGTGEIAFESYTQPVTARAQLTSGMSRSAKFRMKGPWRTIGSTLTPLGWAALTGARADEHIDRYFSAHELLGAEIDIFAEELSRRYNAGELDPEEACYAFADWISAHLKRVPATHETLIEKTIAWLGGSLNPDIEELLDSLAYSRRQAERLVERYFGFPPAAVARKYRAVRAAAMLSQEKLSAAEEAAIRDAFYDQPHMVKEIRRYCGYTPKRLGGNGQPILKTLLQMKNFDRLQEFRATGR